MKMSQDWASLIKTWTQSKSGKIVCKPKMGSRSQKEA